MKTVLCLLVLFSTLLFEKNKTKQNTSKLFIFLDHQIYYQFSRMFYRSI